MVGKDTVIQLIQIGSRHLLISVGREGARFLCELSEKDLIPDTAEENQSQNRNNTKQDPGFLGRFGHNMKVNMGLLPKGTPYMTPTRDKGASTDEKTLPFDAVLRQAEEKQQSPVSDEQQRSGHRHIESGIPKESPPEPSKPPRKINYQNSIDQMVKLGEPDLLDRRAKPAPSLSEYAAELHAVTHPSPDNQVTERKDKGQPVRLENPIQSPLKPMHRKEATETAASAGNREHQIDTLLDMIAERQSRYQKEKESDKP